jgi:CheY-like chemotaxis protein/HPt (histidine-containing phosphotransfer) domain-containing protein
MGGRIGVEARAGVGSIFWFDVPFGLAIDQGDGDRAEVRVVAGKRLLVVAQSEATRRTVRTYGAAWEARVEDVATAGEAARLVKRAASAGRPYDVVVVDARLQDGTGAELAAVLRQDQGLRDLRLVLLTDRGGQARPAALVRAGFDAWLSKPVAPRRLLGALAHALEGAPVGSLPATRTTESGRQRITLDVIVVDDNLIERDVLTNLLATAGISVKSAGDAKSALELLKRNAFGLALVDPAMTGFEPQGVLAAVRSVVERDCSALPVVALGDADPELERYDGHLAKPVRKADLARMLERWLGEPVHSLRDPASESHEMNDDSNQVLDPEVIATLKELGGDDDPDLFAELVELFLEDTPTRIEALSTALEQQDAIALEQAAHALKSSAGNLGARFLAELFRDIEAAGRDRALERAQPLVQRSSSEFGRVREALRAQVG